MAIPILDLIIGSTTLEPLQRLPSSAFSANLRKVTNGQRSQIGNFHTNTLYKKYTVAISGLAQDLVPELGYEYERDDAIDLYMIVNRVERVSPTGTTVTVNTSRRFRLDYLDVYPIIEYPIGTQIAGSSLTALTNTTTLGQISLSFIPTAGTNSLLVKYYPIISGTIVDMQSTYDWVTDEVSWSLSFEEL